MYNFKLLQSFVAVADAGSFRGAAEKLNRSQSAVSTQVMQLEGQIGLILFERTTRRTKLTPDGEKLLVHMRRALNEIETGLSELRQAASGASIAAPSRASMSRPICTSWRAPP